MGVRKVAFGCRVRIMNLRSSQPLTKSRLRQRLFIGRKRPRIKFKKVARLALQFLAYDAER